MTEMLKFRFSFNLGVYRSEKKSVSAETSGYRRHENANLSGSQALILCMKRWQSPFSSFREELESVSHQLSWCCTDTDTSSIPERTNNQQSAREGSALARFMVICWCREPFSEESSQSFETPAWKSKPFPRRWDSILITHLEISVK